MQRYLETRASYRLADVADQFIASQLHSRRGEQHARDHQRTLTPKPYSLGGNEVWHPADFWTMVLEPLKVKLDEANVPEDGRYAIVPPWAHSLVTQTQGFVGTTDAAGNATPTMQRGFMGTISGFGNILKSNNVPQPIAGGPGAGARAIQAGHPMAITYAEQIAETEALRLQTTFGDGVRGLHVYGAQVVRPDCIAVAYVQRPTGV